MGHYLEALFHTGYYYTFIGVVQVTAAILLLIPRTATLGAILYFPVIVNIAILSFAGRFDDSLFSAPLMVLANLYLLCWDYDKLKYIFSFKETVLPRALPKFLSLSTKFPFGFFGSVFATVVLLELIACNLYELRPFNTFKDCQTQCKNSNNPKACQKFCDCVRNEGQPLDTFLEEYYRATASEKVNKNGNKN